jgi:LAS superfamily LD-carboxypeptidase LdcB
MGIAGGVGKNLVTIDAGGQSVQVNAQAAPHFKAFLDDLQSRGYKIDSIGGYSDRFKVINGRPNPYAGISEHGYGNAIDINDRRNPQGTSRTDLPANISQIAAKYGLIWGGEWNGKSVDPMHFEWSGKGGATTFASR